MVSIYKTKREQIRDKKIYITSEFRGLSSDTKPTTWSSNNENKIIDNGSVFIEMDTQKITFYDLENQTWKEV